MDYNFIDGNQYWAEDTCYEFTLTEVEEVESATNEIHGLCLKAVDHVINQKRLAEFKIPVHFHDLVTRSWKNHEFSLYGRMDLSYAGQGSTPKFLEYNADTPTSLLEASVVQWKWLEGQAYQLKNKDQFNSIHEKLIEAWKNYAKCMPGKTLHFSSLADSVEDYRNVEYLMDCAMQAGITSEYIELEKIGSDRVDFYDLKNKVISDLFKLYPWEWVIRDEFSKTILNSTAKIIEPAWKMILSNKMILPILWELFPNHPNLLPSFTDPTALGNSYVKKPILSREGSNVEIYQSGLVEANSGAYGAEGFIYQGVCKLPKFDEYHALVGSWVVNNQACGMGIREDKSLITGNLSRFVPHYFVEE
jgi:glutathionylspermidine synthase